MKKCDIIYKIIILTQTHNKIMKFVYYARSIEMPYDFINAQKYIF